MLNIVPGTRPDSDAGYLEMMTAIIFMGGLSRQVVMGKWDGFLAAFENFDLPTVAGFTDVDVERLSQDTRIVRYKAKIRAVVKAMVEDIELFWKPSGKRYETFARGVLTLRSNLGGILRDSPSIVSARPHWESGGP